jgi:hypothetical protein
MIIRTDPVIHTPSLSPSLARGIFHFGDMVSDASFQQGEIKSKKSQNNILKK